MRIGINLLYLIPGVVGGTETYAAGLLKGLAEIDQTDEFVVYVNKESKDWPLPSGSNFVRVVCPLDARKRYRRYFFEQFHLPGLLRKQGIGIVHSLGYISPLIVHCPTIVTIHDLNFRVFGKELSLSRRLALEFFVRQSVLRADRIIAVTEFSRREIIREFNVGVDRIAVIHEAPRVSNSGLPSKGRLSGVASKFGITPPYILAFSSLSPNKNIPNLLQAFALARDKYRLPHRLVVVGHLPVGAGPLINNSQLPEHIIFTGHLDDGSLNCVLADAELLVFPSYYEGFGLPVVEAMAAGVPVACSEKGSLPEVAGSSAVFFDPHSVPDIAEKIAKVAGDPNLQRALRKEGLENVKRFSWKKTATRTLEVYYEVVNGFSREKPSGEA
jgi:glycosyltransferase involved in cell wall biosynthesis